MSIWSIDGNKKDAKGRSHEEEFNINLLIRNKGWIGVQLDVEITPIFCVNCNKQVNGFFKHDGSRYGQVGNVICNHCGTEIYCTDHDNIVDELRISSSDGKTKVLNYYKLYGLEEGIWISLRDKIGYDILERYEDNKWTTLQSVMYEICSMINIPLNDIPSRHIVTDHNLPTLPIVVTKWLSLIEYLHINFD